SGFNGSPSFVTNIGEYLRRETDVALGKMLTNVGWDNLCQPIRFNVRLAVQVRYQQGGSEFLDEAQCTLSGAVENVENFFAGDFTSGGWENWIQATMQP